MSYLQSSYSDYSFETIWAPGESVEIVWEINFNFAAAIWLLRVVPINRGYGFEQGLNRTICG
jgi:hypothetical protein